MSGWVGSYIVFQSIEPIKVNWLFAQRNSSRETMYKVRVGGNNIIILQHSNLSTWESTSQCIE